MCNVRLLALILLLTNCIFAQDKSSSEEQIVSVLRQSSPAQKQSLLIQLGVPAEIATRYQDLSASLSNEIKWLRLPVKSNLAKASILFLPCQDGSDMASMYLVVNEGPGWRVTDQFDADCHYKGDVSVELVPEVAPGQEGILLHQDCTGHGTGFVVHNFHVFITRSGKLKEVLNTEESMFAAGWKERGTLRRSLFAPIPSSKGTTIEQTQTIQRLDSQTDQIDSRSLRVKRRKWIWSPEKQHMVPTPFEVLGHF